MVELNPTDIAGFAMSIIQAIPGWEQSNALRQSDRGQELFGQYPSEIMKSDAMKAGMPTLADTRDAVWGDYNRGEAAWSSGQVGALRNLERNQGIFGRPEWAPEGYRREQGSFRSDVTTAAESMRSENQRAFEGEMGAIGGGRTRAFSQISGTKGDLASARGELGQAITQGRGELRGAESASMAGSEARRTRALGAYEGSMARNMEIERQGLRDSFTQDMDQFLADAGSANMNPAQMAAEGWKKTFRQREQVGLALGKSMKGYADTLADIGATYDNETSALAQVWAAETGAFERGALGERGALERTGMMEIGATRRQAVQADMAYTKMEAQTFEARAKYNNVIESWKVNQDLIADEMYLSGLREGGEYLNQMKWNFPLKGGVSKALMDMGRFDTLMDMGAFQDGIALGVSSWEILQNSLAGYQNRELAREQMASNESIAKTGMIGQLGSAGIQAVGGMGSAYAGGGPTGPAPVPRDGGGRPI